VKLLLRARTLELRPGRPLLMGVLNAAPDSFSDPWPRGVGELVERGREMAAAGAAIVDVGGESGRTDRPPVAVREEIARVVPVVERLAADGIDVSVDTWRAPVARAVLDAGAAMINDVSALREPELADACAAAGAALVLTHTRIAPKTKGFPAYGELVAEVRSLLAERAEEAGRRGLDAEHIVLDPGLDLAKTPAQSVELLRRLGELRSLGRPLLVSASRKDFIGALTGRRPSERLAGTLAALDAAVAGGAAMLRVHDVVAARDYLEVRAALRGDRPVPTDLRLDLALRREPDERVA
jgi:dihydropteroate synthase